MIETMEVYIRKLAANKKGQGTVEYGFILFMIALAVTLAVKTLGEKIAQLLNAVTF